MHYVTNMIYICIVDNVHKSGICVKARPPIQLRAYGLLVQDTYSIENLMMIDHKPFRLQVTCYMLWVTGSRLQVTGYGLQVTGYGLQVTGYRLQVTCYRFQEDLDILNSKYKMSTILAYNIIHKYILYVQETPAYWIVRISLPE